MEAKSVKTIRPRSGIDASLISMHVTKPPETRAMERLVSAGPPIVTLEEHNIIGGLGSAVAEVIALSGATVRFGRYGIPDSFVHSGGSQEFLRNELGIDGITEDIKKELL
jgi:transketolase